MDPTEHRAYGVFKPIGHMVVSFPDAASADEGQAALAALGTTAADIHRYSAAQMLAQCDEDIARASPAASVGQELNLVKANRELAAQGFHFLVVRVDNDDAAREAADALHAQGAERAQLYGRFIIEEMITRAADLPQVKESPDTGLDPQTPSGEEKERAQMRPPESTP
ncbi:MAG: hypothetical protein RSB42_03365 [Comamonas sp.]